MNSAWVRRIFSRLAARSKLDPYFLRLRDLYERQNTSGKYKKIAKTGGVELPISLSMALTMRCNLRCFMCYQTKYRESEKKMLARKELTAREWDNFLKSSRAYIKRVGLTGGEVFVRDDIFEILDTLERLKIPFNILTNGVLIDEKRAGKLISYQYLDTLCFSVHGFEKTYDEIVGVRGSFEKVAQAIRMVAKKNFWVAVNCTISDKNLSELSKLVSFSASQGVDSIGFQLENFVTSQEEKNSRGFLKGSSQSGFVQLKKESVYPYSYSALMRAWNSARRMGRKKSLPVTFNPSLFYSQPKIVYSGGAKKAGFQLFCQDLLNGRINPEGNVIACQFLPQKFGNIKKESLRKIWFSPQFKNYRQRLLTNNLMQVCNRCCKMKRVSS